MIKSVSVTRQYAPLRVCGDMCFYYFALAVLSLSTRNTAFNETGAYGVVSNMVAPWALQLSIMVGACFVLGFLIMRIDNAFLRFIISLLPGLTFLMSPLRPVLLIHAAAFVYYVLFMTIGNFEVYLDVYRGRSRLMLLATMLLACFLIIFHFGIDTWTTLKLYGGEHFGLAYFVLAVLSLRGMRLSFGAPLKMRALDIVHVVALPAVIITVFFLLRGAVPGITWLVSMLTRFLKWIYNIFFPEKEIPVYKDPDEFDQQEDGGEPIIRPITENDNTVTEPISGEDPHIRVHMDAWLWIITIILVIALICIAVKLIRNKRKNSEAPKRARERFVKVMPERQQRRRSAEPALSPNVRQIRRTYKSYLELIRGRYMKIFPSDTSEDVRDNTSGYLDIPENSAIRELYIAARYGDPRTVTPDQVAEAKRCLTAIESVMTGAADQV